VRVRHLGPQLVERRLEGPGARHEDRVHSAKLRRPEPTVRRAQPPAGAVTADRAPDLPAHREARPRWPSTRHPQEDKSPPLLTPALLEDRLDLGGVPEAGVPGKPEWPDGSAHNSIARQRDACVPSRVGA
jgi:hypothetical protein